MARFHFAVPVISRRMAKAHWLAEDNPDGRSAEAAASRCISSLVNQTVPCVVHLVCHDVPELELTARLAAACHVVRAKNLLRDHYLSEVAQDRCTLVIHEVDFPTPDRMDRDTYERLSGKPIPQLPPVRQRRIGDKYAKIKSALSAALYDPLARFFMPVDHDDLIHKDVVEYALEHDGLYPGGHTVTQGYSWRVGENVFREMGGFHKICGSCNAVRLSDDEHDVWNATHDVYQLGPRKQHWLFAGHSSTFARLREAGRNTAKFPFRAAVYVTDTGSNFSGTKQHGRGTVPLTDELRAQFGMF